MSNDPDEWALTLCHHCGQVFLAEKQLGSPFRDAQDHCLDNHPEAWESAVFSDLWSHRIAILLGDAAAQG